ncbi:hypothetical protein UFOVP217_30 [uncultured Caudovirales phage]|jgi:predicted secreted protein|uniref:Uncharacterized protein n=1 Tax=uncultured Caudovirales phage TaxID=2100421 RepID=A0A6J7WNT9_9CAUD|nr:hypothetical protein UFOVP217_30 [uncultured Caudovirales phage]
MGKVNGKDVVLSIYNIDLDTYIPIACARSITFDIQRDTIETSITGSGNFRTYIGGAASFTGNCDGLVQLDCNFDTYYHMGGLYDLMLNNQAVDIKYFEEDQDGNELSKECLVIIESINETSSFDNVNTFSIGFKGVGTPVITYNTCARIFDNTFDNTFN